MNKRATIGLVLIAVGVLLIIQKTLGYEIEVWSFAWPLFLIIFGVSMHINYFSNKNEEGNLILAGIITTYGIYFLINILTNKVYAHMTSFVYPFGIGIGFMESYIFGDKRNGYLSAGIVFLIIALVIFLKDFFPKLESFREFIIPCLLIIFGVSMLLKNNDILKRGR